MEGARGELLFSTVVLISLSSIDGCAGTGLKVEVC